MWEYLYVYGAMITVFGLLFIGVCWIVEKYLNRHSDKKYLDN